MLMDRLGLPKVHVIGHLHLLWWWCIDYAQNGQIRYGSEQIARAAEYEGDAKIFVNALVEAQFIDDSNGALSVHDWFDFCGRLIEKRLERRDSVRRQTGQSGRRKLPKGARKLPTSDTTNQPTVPNPTVPNPTNQTKDAFDGLAIPADLLSSGPEIKDWLEYKRQKNQTYKPKGLEALWRMIRAIPPEKRRESIDHSMSNNWSGLFEKKGVTNEKQRTDGYGTQPIKRDAGKPGKFSDIGTVVEM